VNQPDSTRPQQISQSRCELRRHVSGLLDLARELDCQVVLYHLERAYAVLGLRRDRDVLRQGEDL